MSRNYAICMYNFWSVCLGQSARLQQRSRKPRPFQLWNNQLKLYFLNHTEHCGPPKERHARGGGVQEDVTVWPPLLFVTGERSRPRDVTFKNSFCPTYKTWDWNCYLTLCCDGCILTELVTSVYIIIFIKYNAAWNFKSQITLVMSKPVAVLHRG